mmetsp:Transcript_7241/g.27635  ORF Transcript_7241/g.27635 Transcript_7241/m.27635 type:complete len:327 (+) Transcript_7241:223-1203(+)
MLIGEMHCNGGGRDAFHRHVLQNVVKQVAPCKPHSCRAIPRQGPESCKHQVAHAAQAADRRGLSAHGDGQLLKLQLRLGHVRRHGVEAFSLAFDHASADGQRVLQSASKLHPDDVGGRVHPEPERAEHALDELRLAEVRAGDDHRRRLHVHDLLRKGRARQIRQALVALHGIPNGVAQQLSRRQVQAFPGDAQGHLRGDAVPVLLQEVGGPLRRQRHDDERGALARFLDAGGGVDVLGNLELAHGLVVAPLLIDACHLIRVSGVEADFVAVSRRHGSHGSAEGACPDHRHLAGLHVGQVVLWVCHHRPLLRRQRVPHGCCCESPGA